MIQPAQSMMHDLGWLLAVASWDVVHTQLSHGQMAGLLQMGLRKLEAMATGPVRDYDPAVVAREVEAVEKMVRELAARAGEKAG